MASTESKGAQFTVRYPDEEKLAVFDRLASKGGKNRNEQICELIDRFVLTQGNSFYTLKAFAGDGRSITIEYANGNVYQRTDGGSWGTGERVRIEHAMELCRRAGGGDLEKAMHILQALVGEEGDVVKLDE